MSHCARVQELCIHVTLRAAHTHARAHAHIRVEVTLPNVRESPQEVRICPLPALAAHAHERASSQRSRRSAQDLWVTSGTQHKQTETEKEHRTKPSRTFP